MLVGCIEKLHFLNEESKQMKRKSDLHLQPQRDWILFLGPCFLLVHYKDGRKIPFMMGPVWLEIGEVCSEKDKQIIALALTAF